MRTVAAAAVLFASLAAGVFAQGQGEDPAQVVGPPRGPRLEGAALEARVKDVGGLLRCPVCQGLSVADSPSTMAQNMRTQVRELLAAGYDQDQILSYYERSYGEFVRLKPALRGVNWLVWLAPVVGLVLGAVVIAWALRAPRATASADGDGRNAAEVPGADALPADPSLARYVLRVRERAYGWPGGLSPARADASAPAATADAAVGKQA